jgi:hypothetical protein
MNSIVFKKNKLEILKKNECYARSITFSKNDLIIRKYFK